MLPPLRYARSSHRAMSVRYIAACYGTELLVTLPVRPTFVTTRPQMDSGSSEPEPTKGVMPNDLCKHR
jgi:hypothetical protein